MGKSVYLALELEVETELVGVGSPYDKRAPDWKAALDSEGLFIYYILCIFKMIKYEYNKAYISKYYMHYTGRLTHWQIQICLA